MSRGESVVVAGPDRPDQAVPTAGRPSTRPSAAESGAPGQVRANDTVQPCRPANPGAATSKRPTRDADASGWLRLTAASLATTPADDRLASTPTSACTSGPAT